MIKELNILQVLVFHDLPQLFVATDAVHTRYLCLFVDEEGEEINYIATSISLDRLMSFKNGTEDLRNIFEYPETNELYYFDAHSDAINAKIWEDSNLPERFLPEEGFIYSDNSSKEEDLSILKESNEIVNTVVHLSISESNNRKGINLDDLGDVVKLYQSIIENGQKKTISQSKLKNKKPLTESKNFELRAHFAMTGSLILHLYSNSDVDLFGNSDAEFGLKAFDKITSEVSTEDYYINSLREFKGYTIGGLKNLTRKLIDDNLTISHKWATPSDQTVHSSYIDPEKARKIFEILNLTDELTEETIELVGIIRQIDVEKGTWTVLNDSDKKEYSGGVDDTELLKGLTTLTVSYALTCTSIIEELKVSEKSKKKYTLKSIMTVTE